MSTRTTDIVNAIITRLAALNARAGTEQPWDFEATDTTPVVVVDVESEYPEGVVGGAGGLIYWNLGVSLYIAANGAIPKLAPETTRQTAHVALYSDRTFGGLAIDIVAGVVKRGIDQDNPACGITICSYTVQYRIGESTL